MEQKIKLELTEQEAKIVKRTLLNERQEIAKMIKKASPTREYLWFKQLQDQYFKMDKIIGMIEEPYLV